LVLRWGPTLRDVRNPRGVFIKNRDEPVHGVLLRGVFGLAGLFGTSVAMKADGPAGRPANFSVTDLAPEAQQPRKLFPRGVLWGGSLRLGFSPRKVVHETGHGGATPA
jgi:hypothetical protein